MKGLSKTLSLVLAFVMVFGLVTPAFGFANTESEAQVLTEEAQTDEAEVVETTEPATEEVVEEPTTEETTEPVVEETTEPVVEETTESEVEETTEPEVQTMEAAVSNGPYTYEDFLNQLKILEGYAEEYAANNPAETVRGLVINFIRTGVERYQDSNWRILAGPEKVNFTAFVEEKEAGVADGAMALRTLNNYFTPNGDEVEFEHMFGALEIAYVNQGTHSSADLGSWAGDVTDLMEFSKPRIQATEIEAMTKEIYDNYLLYEDEVEAGFGILDIYGDLDAFYIMERIKTTDYKVSEIIESYYTPQLTDVDRAAFFLNNRFNGALTNEEVRDVMYEAYASNAGLKVLESSRGLENDHNLRYASVYAFADYLYELAKDHLVKEEDDPEDPEEEDPLNDYYSVFSSNESVLAPGIINHKNLALAKDSQQIAYYVSTIDLNREDVSVHANYYNNQGETWSFSRLTDQMEVARVNHSDPESPKYVENYQPIVGINGDFYNMHTGRPRGALIMEGTTYLDAQGQNFFAILDDKTAMIGTPEEYDGVKDRIVEAMGVERFIVQNGEIAVPKIDPENMDRNRAARSALGITADNKVIFLAVDGRQKPFSAGVSFEEMAQMLIEAGAVVGVNLDGGGSTTMAAKTEGSDEVTVINRPSDAFERGISSSLFAVSTAPASNAFSYATIDAEYDYLMVGSSVALDIKGVSSTGNAAELPEGLTYTTTDPLVGVVENNEFKAVGLGTTEVQILNGDSIVGTKLFRVVVPDSIKFEKNRVEAIYGEPTELPVIVTYSNNPVAIRATDLRITPAILNVLDFDGLTFVANPESGVRTINVQVTLREDIAVTGTVPVTLYSADEAIFDFSQATEGDTSFAWVREVSNSTSLNQADDVTLYNIIKTEEPVDVSYTFALDMQEMPIPEQLSSLTGMLPGSGSGESRAWDFLLSLAERVSDLTTVTFTMQLDENFDVDDSNIVINHEYFNLKEVDVDENNKMTLTVTWVKQSAAIDPSTANSIVIISGLKMKPKEDAAWDAANQLPVINSGNISYDVYLRATALYQFASGPSGPLFGLAPYIHPDDPDEKGGHYVANFKDFSDTFLLDKSLRNGWYEFNGDLYYYDENQPLTGIHAVPSYEDPSVILYYNFDENGVSQGKYTGFIENEEGLRYAISGSLRTGWQALGQNNDVNYYYFNPQTGLALDGEQRVDGYDFVFENHILVKGDMVTDSVGTRYRFANSFYYNKWFDYEGDLYYAKRDNYLATGFIRVLNQAGDDWSTYLFDENGRFMGEYNGLYHQGANTYLLENGEMVIYAGLVEIDGNFYYFNDSNRAVKNGDYWVTKTNGLKEEQSYKFDENGILIEPTIQKEGIIAEDGSLYYYENGVRTYAGLINIDGYYYYVRTSGELVRNRDYWITKHNDLLPEDNYYFDNYGRLMDEDVPLPEEPTDPVEPEDPTDPEDPVDPEDPTIKNGIVAEEGSLFYYVDDVRTYAGLININGFYYYVRTSGELVRDRIYWITNHNDLLPLKNYYFDDQGRLVDESVPFPVDPELKNGIVEEDGSLFYYENGERTYAGLFYLDGYYYYARTSGELVTDRIYWITKHHGLLPERNYYFNAEGQISDGSVPGPEDPEQPGTKNGIVSEEGSLFYYVDGVRTYAGLILVDGNYYYVRTSGELVQGREYWVTKTNGLLKETNYSFNELGQLVQ